MSAMLDLRPLWISPAITIRARVSQARYLGGRVPGRWAATAVAREAGRIVSGKHREAESWPEAMQAAQVLRAELERELTDEVHASRGDRHAARAAELATETTDPAQIITTEEPA